ncbi:MAG: hypothetical protein O2960_29225 [Verrucomicrobia bacterium]|nr:hypothetical protein [Verrucomicrobiota bacterium]
MKSLQTRFTHDGFDFRQLSREGTIALFEKSKPSHSRESFEVVIVQTRPAENVLGREYPVRESLPPAGAWGTSGWTYTELEDAKTKFRALIESSQEGRFQPDGTPASGFSAGGSVNIAGRKDGASR